MLSPAAEGSPEFERSAGAVQFLHFLILGQHVRVQCQDAALRRVLLANFGAMAATYAHGPPDLDYNIGGDTATGVFSLAREGQTVYEAANAGDVLFLLEKDVIVELQTRRPDLLFLHAAAIDWQGRVCLLAAESGGGKSTTSWGLLHHGFNYLSDELSPVDLDSMRVFPYPHALCLKRPAVAGYRLPASALDLGRTIHIPARSLPGTTVSGSRPIGAVFLVTHSAEFSAPSMRAVGPAEASARLYVTALNALAHPNCGLDAVIRVCETVPCFAVSCAELSATCDLIRSTTQGVIGLASERAR
jgi:hypothetical protein